MALTLVSLIIMLMSTAIATYKPEVIWSTLLCIGLALPTFAALVFLVRTMLRASYTTPLLANRKTGNLIQVRDGQRVQAKWVDLVPYVVTGNTLTTAGGAVYYHLYLLSRPPERGSFHGDYFIIKNAAPGSVGCVEYYEFLRRYMAGEWEGVPDIHLTGGLRRSLWMEFRRAALHFGQLDLAWEQRTDEDRRWMWVWVPVLVLLSWPMTFLSVVGSRIGHIPSFSPEDLQQASWNEDTDGPMPDALASKIHPAAELHPTEKKIYLFSILIATALWAFPLYWFALLMTSPLHS